MNKHSSRFPWAAKLPYIAVVAFIAFAAVAPVTANWKNRHFKRIATFPIFENTCDGEPASCIDEETVAEIVAVTEDGNLLIYTDSETENIGFVDITNPSNPQPAGLVDVGGEPTSVAVSNGYALVAVNTSPNFVSPSGELKVIDIASRTIVRTMSLGGQPDSVAVSHNNRFAAIAIENERDEDLNDGGLPQLPAGFLVIVDLVGPPANWSLRNVSLTGIADKFPTDPEPEFVDINALNVAVVTLQENNHIILVHLPSGNVIHDFSAGTVDLNEIDIEENSLIEQVGALTDVPREPDAVTWITPLWLATADEGDLEGGSRGFTIFRADGKVSFTSGNRLERLVTRLGHYPEERSENKGNEPESIAQGRYGWSNFLFVGSERSSVIFVYELRALRPPKLHQVLPAGLEPEGLLPIPERNLFVASSEEDDREETIRSSITIYELQHGAPDYPTVLSANRPDGLPIPWGALSALAADPYNPGMVYTAYDSFYNKSRIFGVDVSRNPAVITDEIVLNDGSGGTFNFDPEGVAVREYEEGFWVVSEGSGSCDSIGVCPDVESINLLLEVAPDGEVLQQIPLPDAVNDIQRNNGFEGVASVGTGDDELVYVAFQRAWNLEDPDDRVRIGRYEVLTGDWTFFYYPLDTPTSPNGGWVGLSELVALDSETFAVIERDNQAGPDATIKKIYEFSISGLTPAPQGGVFPVVTKTLVRDILPDLEPGRYFLVPSPLAKSPRRLQTVCERRGLSSCWGRPVYRKPVGG